MINPWVFLCGTCGFLAAFIFHVLIWRLLKPVKQLAWLVIIFVLLPLLSYILVSPGNAGWIMLWHLLLSTAYILSYPAIQAQCPTLRIILAVSGSMPQGLEPESIIKLFTQDSLFSVPFDSLADEGLIYLKGDKWFLSAGGRLLSGFFCAYRRLLGLPQGEG